MLTETYHIKHPEESNELLENYFRNTIITQLFIDASLRLQKFTPPVITEFKITPTDIGRHINDIKDKFRFQMLVEDIQEVINSGNIIEKEVETTDSLWYQINIIPFITRNNNKTNGVIVTFVDITRRIKALKDLECVFTDHEVLLDTIFHDLRTPLTTLLTAFHLIQEVPPSNEQMVQRLVPLQVQSLEKMKHIIYGLTHPPQQQHGNKTEEVANFGHMLEDVRLTLKSNIARAGALISSGFNVLEIKFPQRSLRSILYNLVNNAVKYRSPDRSLVITVTTKCEDDFIVLSVKDNGLGIEKTKQENVFIKHFSIGTTAEGTGIGLHLVKQNVIRAGGKIVLQSQLGEGSEFKVYLKA